MSEPENKIDNRLRGPLDVPICFTLNEGYLQHFYVALISLLDHNRPGWIYLIDEDLNEDSKATIRNVVSELSPQTEVTFIRQTPNKNDNQFGFEERLGQAAFLRLKLAALLPTEIEVVLYLDSDIIILRELDYKNIPIHQHIVCAVKDPSSDLFAPKRGIEKMFNTGVLFLNLALWRLEHIDVQLAECKPAIRRLADQELLNEVFNKRWFELPSTWNENALYLISRNGSYYNSDGKEAIVLHFMGTHKPWAYLTTGSQLYWKYVLRSPLKTSLLKALLTPVNSVLYSLDFRFKQIQRAIQKRVD